MGHRHLRPLRLVKGVAFFAFMLGVSGAALSADLGAAPRPGNSPKPMEIELHTLRVADLA